MFRFICITVFIMTLSSCISIGHTKITNDRYGTTYESEIFENGKIYIPKEAEDPDTKVIDDQLEGNKE